jgi:hypothetical protein
MFEMTIDSTVTNWYRAVVGEQSDGQITVAIFQRLPGDGITAWKLLQRETLDVPRHLALDQVHSMINKLSPPDFFTVGAKKGTPRR